MILVGGMFPVNLLPDIWKRFGGKVLSEGQLLMNQKLGMSG